MMFCLCPKLGTCLRSQLLLIPCEANILQTKYIWVCYIILYHRWLLAVDCMYFHWVSTGRPINCRIQPVIIYFCLCIRCVHQTHQKNLLVSSNIVRGQQTPLLSVGPRRWPTLTHNKRVKKSLVLSKKFLSAFIRYQSTISWVLN